MTNPSQTRDSELVAKLRGADPDHVSPIDALRLFDSDSATFPLSPEDAETILDLIDRAADTIDRLTSSGEAVAWVWRYEDEKEWRDAQVIAPDAGQEAKRRTKRVFAPTYLHASPREGHVEVPVEPTEVLWIAFSMEYAVEGYENFAKAYRAMLSARPHNQGETKP